MRSSSSDKRGVKTTRPIDVKPKFSDRGEHRRRFVPLKTCIVTFTDLEGSRHSVEVVADSLFEAAALALKAMAQAEFIEPNPGPASRLEIQVRPPVSLTP